MIVARSVCKASIRSSMNLSSKNKSKQSYPAADRNKAPILETLKLYIEKKLPSLLLEISSGSGQHVSHFAVEFPNVTFQPTEFEAALLPSINSYIEDSNASNIKEAKVLDVRSSPLTWLNHSVKEGSFDYVLNVNMMHISEYACTEGLFQGSSYVLKPGGSLFTYGPYASNGIITPDSNVRFDASLRSQNPAWGLRDIHLQLIPLAKNHGIELKQLHDLPANNKLLVWQKIN